MDRRRFLNVTSVGLVSLCCGCRGKQFARVSQPGDADLVGSHQAGAETFKPLTEEAVAKLLGRHCSPFQQAAYVSGPEQLPPPGMRICFVGVENKSAEEIGDFKEQLYEVIDSKILESHVFQPISKRYVDAALRETRLRPDSLFIPQNMRMFSGFLEQQGQPFDYLLYATITSGTTRENQEYQRDYLLTLEMVNVHNGEYDKQSASLSKTYHKTRIGRMMQALQ
jgi:peptidoglycan-synthase activator LpoB